MAVVAALTIPLAACATYQGARAPSEVEIPDRFALVAGAVDAELPTETLLPFEDAAYGALLNDALTGAPDLQAALARIDAARAGARGAGAARLPNATAGGSVTRERTSAATFGGLPANIPFDTDRTIYSASVDASWDLDIFGRLRASERAALARLDAARADAAAVRIALAADIARAVIAYRAAEARLAVIEGDLAEARDLVRLTDVRSRAGIAPGFDLVRARSLEADALARRGPVETDRVSALATLATLTAQPVPAVLEALDAAPDDRTALAVEIGLPGLAVPSILLRQRPDVVAAENRLAAADAEIAAAAAAQFPSFSISGVLGLISLAFGDLFTDDAVVASLGASVSGPLLDFGRTAAEIDQREAEAAEAFADYRRQVFVALGDVERSLGSIAAADDRAEALGRQLVFDNDNVGLAAIRYRRGLADFLTVIDAQRAANTTRSAEILARADRALQRVALFRAIGDAEALPDRVFGPDIAYGAPSD
ncbi:efflux transporter outer membrane subunit [Parasphingopyxis algicola]|uniref:efflux transporter outer membrane subunit n=1 Tax=Parasphingopyxis algicola TaxID=2026624 RepID=UPI001FE83500|nr:efflux transporter outer membrane subunit [Parasphingopyxis algicola]